MHTTKICGFNKGGKVPDVVGIKKERPPISLNGGYGLRANRLGASTQLYSVKGRKGCGARANTRPKDPVRGLH